jgi:SAM-dependent methyltransferase
MHVLESLRPNWRDLLIHESGPGMRGATAVIVKECSKYIPTHYFPKVQLGQIHNGFRCEDIEHQTFADQIFDIVITQDVYEHIFDPAAATREIYRTLKSGGISIITTGVWKDKLKTEQWARREPDGQITHLASPPEYHGNPIDAGGSLVTFKFGYDFVDLLATWAPFGVELRRFNDRHYGIVGEFTDVVICTKH